MKTTANISLAGYAFTIETDAYTELGRYLNDIREAFRNDANAEEITADIEARIAELLREKCISGMVVDTRMVQDVKNRIGTPQELAQDEAEETESPSGQDQTQEQKKSWRSKRLFRNMDEKMLGGVCSGLGTYFGIDKALFRILFLIFSVIPFIGTGGNVILGPVSILPIPLLYIILWIAMPAARTDEQRREMRGKPTNLESYKTSDFDFKTEVKDAAESPAGKAFKRVGGIFLGLLLLMSGLGGMIGTVVIPSVPSIIRHEISDEMYMDAEEQFVADLLTNNDTFWIFVMIIVGLLSIWFIYNGIMLLFNLKAPSWKPGLVIFISWVISIFIFAGYVAKLAAEALGTSLIII